MSTTGVHFKRWTPLHDYIYKKIRELETEFCLKLTGEEKRHFYEIKTQEAVDIYAQKLIMEKL